MANNSPTRECETCRGRGYYYVVSFFEPTWRDDDPATLENCECCEGSGKVENEDYDPDQPSDATVALYAAANGMLTALGHEPIVNRRELLEAAQKNYDKRKTEAKP